MSAEIEQEPFLKDASPPSSQPRSIRQGALRYSNSSSLKSFIFFPVVSHCTVFIVTSIVWISFMALYSPSSADIDQQSIHKMVSSAKYESCGGSTREAQAAGCQYDILSNHWVPKACIDQEAIADYQSDGSWYAYADENRTQLVALEQMGSKPYHTSVRDHIVHCAMLWKKQYKAFFEGRRFLDSVIVDTEHTMHCAQYLIDMTDYGTDFRDIPITVEIGWAGCYSLDEERA